MSKITYLLGAGASCGTWCIDGVLFQKRGVPTTKKFIEALEFIIADIQQLVDDRLDCRQAKIEKEERKFLADSFMFLKEKCQEYPTIDTYAKQVFVNRSAENPLAKTCQITDYQFVVRVMSAFLLLIQDIKQRDSRYDGFIASVINERREFPPMTILSWNYDAQFEMAYAGYIPEDKNIILQWRNLNVFNKTYLNTKYDSSKSFGMVKLNGTAFYTDKSKLIKLDDGLVCEMLIDNYFNLDVNQKYKIASNLIRYSGSYSPTLSYVWEKSRKQQMVSVINSRCHDTEELIVIGYSFPYVNREVDFDIISSMSSLKRVCIQDPDFNNVKERVKSMLGSRSNNIDIFSDENLSQFHIPNSF